MKHDKDMKGKKGYQDGGSVPETKHPQEFQHGGKLTEEDKRPFETETESFKKLAKEKLKEGRITERIGSKGGPSRNYTPKDTAEFGKFKRMVEKEEIKEGAEEKKKFAKGGKVKADKDEDISATEQEMNKREPVYQHGGTLVETEINEKKRREELRKFVKESKKENKQYLREEEKKEKERKGQLKEFIKESKRENRQYLRKKGLGIQETPEEEIKIMQAGGITPTTSVPDLRKDTTYTPPAYPMGGKMGYGSAKKYSSSSDVNSPDELQHD